MTEVDFRYQDKILEKVYKYLGIVLDDHLTLDNCAEVLAEAGGRPLGSIIAKFKNLKDCT